MGRCPSKIQVFRGEIAWEEHTPGWLPITSALVYQGTGQLLEPRNVIGNRKVGLALFSLATIDLSLGRRVLSSGPGSWLANLLETTNRTGDRSIIRDEECRLGTGAPIRATQVI
jgi:hypothetical protein